MRTIQIETVTLANGGKVEVIRDIEAVRRALAAAENLATRLRLWSIGKDMLCEADAKALEEWQALR